MRCHWHGVQTAGVQVQDGELCIQMLRACCRCRKVKCWRPKDAHRGFDCVDTSRNTLQACDAILLLPVPTF